jgi:hypothetical protein
MGLVEVLHVSASASKGSARALKPSASLAQQRGYKRGWAERVYQARLAKRMASSHWWRILAKALGEKAHVDPRVADRVAAVRVAILLAYMTTNLFICAGVVRHWNERAADTAGDPHRLQQR